MARKACHKIICNQSNLMSKSACSNESQHANKTARNPFNIAHQIFNEAYTKKAISPNLRLLDLVINFRKINKYTQSILFNKKEIGIIINQ